MKKLLVILFSSFSCMVFCQTGKLDKSFGDSGRAIGVGFGNCQAMALQRDGKIVVGGIGYNDTDYGYSIARYNTNGTIDSSFGNDGHIINDFGLGYFCINSLAVLEDGKILAAGSESFQVVRYKPDGSFDKSFGENGVVHSNIGNLGAEDMVVQKDGKIVLIGAELFNSIEEKLILMRREANGSYDSSFGDNGIVTNDFGLRLRCVCGAITRDKKILVAGHVSLVSYSWEEIILRYLPNGQLDSSFGTDGMVITDFGGFDGITSILIQPDDKILAVGNGGPNYSQINLTRFYPNGRFDSSFGNDGKVIFKVPYISVVAQKVLLQPDNKIIVGGYVDTKHHNVYSDFLVMRFTHNGRKDEGFRTHSIAINNFWKYDRIYAMALQQDGKILAAGRSFDGAVGYNFAIVRYLNDINMNNKENLFVSKRRGNASCLQHSITFIQHFPAD